MKIRIKDSAAKDFLTEKRSKIQLHDERGG